MELQSILKADYLDILFDKRNKSYGGYELRKNYNQRAAKATGIVLTALLLLIGVNVFASRFRTEEKAAIPNEKVIELDNIPIDVPEPKPEIVPPPPATAPEPPSQAATIINTKPEITPDDQVTTPPPTVDDLRDKVSGTVNSDDGGGLTPATSEVPGNGTETVAAVVDKPAATDAPFEYVEQRPEFDGDLNKYLVANIQYPVMARETGTKGRVIIRFIVNEDGSVSNAKVIKGIGAGCEEEAIRVVMGMPRWKPGKQNGKAVKVFFTLPVTFAM